MLKLKIWQQTFVPRWAASTYLRALWNLFMNWMAFLQRQAHISFPSNSLLKHQLWLIKALVRRPILNAHQIWWVFSSLSNPILPSLFHSGSFFGVQPLLSLPENQVSTFPWGDFGLSPIPRSLVSPPFPFKCNPWGFYPPVQKEMGPLTAQLLHLSRLML